MIPYLETTCSEDTAKWDVFSQQEITILRGIQLSCAKIIRVVIVTFIILLCARGI